MAFNKDIPTAGTSLRASNPEILENQESVQEAVNNEHIFSGTSASTQTGDHTQGSARCFSQATAPATRIDGNVFISTDLGSLWVDTDDNALYILTATAPTWTPVSTEVIATLLGSARTFLDTLSVIGDFDVNTDKFTVNATTGDAALAGVLAVTGAINPTSYSTVNGGFLDEDNLASDSDTSTASQQSVKAYSDALGGAGRGFIKAWVSFDGDTGTINGTGFNITSVSRTAAGKYTITWETDFADDDYVISGFTADGSLQGAVCNASSNIPLSAGSALIETRKISDGAIADFNLVTIIAIGDQ